MSCRHVATKDVLWCALCHEEEKALEKALTNLGSAGPITFTQPARSPLADSDRKNEPRGIGDNLWIDDRSSIQPLEPRARDPLAETLALDELDLELEDVDPFLDLEDDAPEEPSKKAPPQLKLREDFNPGGLSTHAQKALAREREIDRVRAHNRTVLACRLLLAAAAIAVGLLVYRASRPDPYERALERVREEISWSRR